MHYENETGNSNSKQEGWDSKFADTTLLQQNTPEVVGWVSINCNIVIKPVLLN